MKRRPTARNVRSRPGPGPSMRATPCLVCICSRLAGKTCEGSDAGERAGEMASLAMLAHARMFETDVLWATLCELHRDLIHQFDEIVDFNIADADDGDGSN